MQVLQLHSINQLGSLAILYQFRCTGIYESDEKVIQYCGTGLFSSSSHSGSSSSGSASPCLIEPAPSAVRLSVEAAPSSAALTASWKGTVFASSLTQCPRGSVLSRCLPVLKLPASWHLRTPPRWSCAAPTTCSTTAPPWASPATTTTFSPTTAWTLPFTARQGVVI
jgi:hypothetical protein